jgi:thioredoxin 1
MAVTKITDAEFASILAENPKVVIKYFATWCGSCRLFAPKFKRISEDPNYEGTLFLEIDAENNPEARKTAGVDNLPFFASFKDGKLVEGKSAAKEEVVRAITEAVQ